MARIESGEAELNEDVGNIRELVESIKAVFEPEVERKNWSEIIWFTSRMNLSTTMRQRFGRYCSI